MEGRVDDNEREDILKDREYMLLGTSTWIDVRNLTVNVQRVGNGVRVDIWPKELMRGYEPIASVEVPFREGKDNDNARGW
jgi:hypothetical protein